MIAKKNNKVQVEQYIRSYYIQKVRLLESSETTKNLIHDIHLGNKKKLSILVTAIKKVATGEELLFFKGLMKHEYEIKDSEAMNLFYNTASISEDVITSDLKNELKQILQVSKAEERGFCYNEKKDKYSFNANVFVKHLVKRCHVRCTKDGRLFLYNNKGFYKELSEYELGTIIRTIMHEGVPNSWNSKDEAEIIKALKREVECVDEMNNNRDYINLKNGLLCLNSFTLQPHSPEFLSTIQIPINYDPNATAPKFLKFMREITLEDEELIRVHQELLGYWLTVETKAEKAVYYYGRGANGKSVLSEVVRALVGEENVSNLSLSKFNEQFGLQGIIGKTLNISAENELSGKLLNTENIKSIISGDNLTIDIKYRNPIDYKPFCRLLFLVNNLPNTSDVTNGYFRKLLIIPFKRTFPPGKRNVNLKQELLEELPGILNWALEGLNRLKNNNYQFSYSKAIDGCLKTYLTEQNPVKEFFEEHIVFEEGVRTKQSEFHKKYLQWLNMQGIDDKGTKSKQIFWRNFKILLDNASEPIIRKKIKGYTFLEGIKIVGLDEENHVLISNDVIHF